MKYFFLILLSFLSIGFLYAQHPTIEKGFALVQSRIETNEFNVLKGKKVLPSGLKVKRVLSTNFQPNKPIFPIKKQGSQKQGNSNAVYIQSANELRLFVFPDGFPQNFNLASFNPLEPKKNTKTPFSVAENKDILLDINFIDHYFTVMVPSATNRTQQYFQEQFQGQKYFASWWTIYRIDKNKFRYKNCIEGNTEGHYNINELKGSTPNNSRIDLRNGRSITAREAVPVVEPRIRLNTQTQWTGNNVLRNNREEHATNFQDLTPGNKVLSLSIDGKLDLEKSWKSEYDGREQCNKVGYRYDGFNYLMFFRYVRRNTDKFGQITCSGAGQDCKTSYLQDLIIPHPHNSIYYNLMFIGPRPDEEDTVDELMGGPPSEGDVAGIPKPE